MRLGGAVTVVAFLTACTHVTVTAPHGRHVRLLRADEAAQVRRQYRAWFALWGAVRLSGKDPVDVIRDEALTEARVRVEDNVPDAALGVVYTILEPVGIVPQTIIVEGNRTAREGMANHGRATGGLRVR